MFTIHRLFVCHSQTVVFAPFSFLQEVKTRGAREKDGPLGAPGNVTLINALNLP